MHIYLPDIKLKDGEAVDFVFNENLARLDPVFPEDGKFTLKVSVFYLGDKVIINGTVEAVIETTCSRCLIEFEQPFQTDFNEAFTVLKGMPSNDRTEHLAAVAANTLTVSGDYFYLDDYVRQLIILAQEYNPLCSADCKGLCPLCGTDLNKESCSCAKNSEQTDIRLLKLKEINHNNLE